MAHNPIQQNKVEEKINFSHFLFMTVHFHHNMLIIVAYSMMVAVML